MNIPSISDQGNNGLHTVTNTQTPKENLISFINKAIQSAAAFSDQSNVNLKDLQLVGWSIQSKHLTFNFSEKLQHPGEKRPLPPDPHKQKTFKK